MSDHPPLPRETTWVRLTRPEMLIALSAVLLSLCGLFVSIYETSLIRKQQHASVWPHLGIGYSHSEGQFSFMVLNLGIGPARIRDVLVTVDGEPVTDWAAMFKKLGDVEVPVRYQFSSFNQIVLPAGDRYKVLWIEHGPGEGDAARRETAQLIQHIVENRSRIAITVCYSSVYGQHWLSRMGDPQPEEVSEKAGSFGEVRRFRM